MEKPRAELLAPAGSLSTLKAVAAAGADAVYGAGEQFGARAYAGNLTGDELLEALEHLHLRGKRFYLTVNTLLKEQELSGILYDFILPLYEHGLDGVIVQDLGVLRFLGQQFPGMELHASTQMSITGPHGARLLKELGVSRIVPARELSFAELSRIRREVGMELETFIHGALCYCYSGQCLFSSMLGGRSGNRGRCAQPCRLPYRAVEETGKPLREGYLLSPKDLCAIEVLPRILASGVYSLKIEGRMKQLEYAAGVTGIYREYLDRCLYHPKEPYRVKEADRRHLLELGSRSGCTAGYYEMRNGPAMMAMEKSAHTSADAALKGQMRARFGKASQEKIKGILRLSKGFPAVFLVEWNGLQASAEGDAPQEARGCPLTREGVLEKLQKTGNSEFVFESLDIRLEDNLFLPVGELNRLRREALEKLKEQALLEFRREKPVMKQRSDEGWKVEALGTEEPDAEEAGVEEAGVEHQFCMEKEKPYLAVSIQSMDQLPAALDFAWADRIYLESDALPDPGAQGTDLWAQTAEQVHRAGKTLYYVMPACLREDSVARYEAGLSGLRQAGIDGFVTGNYEGLGLLSAWRKREASGCRILADSSLYVWNAESRRALAGIGADEVTLPLEANAGELRSRAFAGGELVIYGYLPLMVSAQCVLKNTGGCRKQSGFLKLSDRLGKQFKVRNQCRDCYNVIYNSSPLWLFHQRKLLDPLGVSGYRISFTTEKEQKVRQVLSCYERVFVRGEAPDPGDFPREYTNGHFKRGVE